MHEKEHASEHMHAKRNRPALDFFMRNQVASWNGIAHVLDVKAALEKRFVPCGCCGSSSCQRAFTGSTGGAHVRLRPHALPFHSMVNQA